MGDTFSREEASENGRIRSQPSPPPRGRTRSRTGPRARRGHRHGGWARAGVATEPHATLDARPRATSPGVTAGPGGQQPLRQLAVRPGSEQHRPPTVPAPERRKTLPRPKFNEAIRTNTAAYSLNTRYFCNPCPASALSPSVFASVPPTPRPGARRRSRDRAVPGDAAEPPQGPTAAPPPHPPDMGVERW